MSEYFNWTRNTLIYGIRAEEWYNGQPPLGQRGFVADRNSRVMGWAVLRQLRVRHGRVSEDGFIMTNLLIFY